MLFSRRIALAAKDRSINRDWNKNTTIEELCSLLVFYFYFVDKNVANDEEEDSGNEYSAINQPVQNKKKKRSEKNRQFRAVARRNLEATTKVELKKLKDINKYVMVRGGWLIKLFTKWIYL